MATINLDFETFSECDIRKAGAWVYSCHPTTEVLCAAYSIDGGDVVLWTPEDGEPSELIEAVKRGAVVNAWNSFFEFAIWNNATNWPALPVEQTFDTAAQAAALALPRSLAGCGAALDLPQDQQKDKRGKFLIQRVCVPYRGKRNRDPKLLRELYDYCVQDVKVEQKIGKMLIPLTPTERAVWLLDQKVNARGVYVDRDAVESAIEIAEKEAAILNKEVSTLTGGELQSVSSRAAVMAYAESKGYPLESYTSGYVESVAKDDNAPEVVRRLAEIRLKTGKTSVKKYSTLIDILSEDDRARGLLMYHGASTGRWTGRLFQPQNLPRPPWYLDGSEEAAIKLIKNRCSDSIKLCLGDTMEVLSGAIRSTICAPEGSRLLVADYSAIEARVLPWLAGQEDILDVFRDHGKIYEYTAEQIYGTRWQDIGKDSEERFVGKVATLALGYGGGAKAFQGMAEAYGVDIPEDKAEDIKKRWRNSNKHIVSFWDECERAAIKAVRNPGETFEVRAIKFRKVRSFLFCKLPSGRMLAYFLPKIGEGRFGNDCVTFMGTNSVTRKWERQDTYGGKLVENITQAVARDIMAHAMLNIEKAGYRIVLSVHDELIAEAVDGVGSIEDFKNIMCQLPPWAEGLPLDASGFEAKRYKK